MGASADLVARGGRGGSVYACRRRAGTAAGEIKDAQFLILATRCENLRVRLVWECDGADNVGMIERVERFSGLRVPDLGGEVGGAGSCESRIGGKAGRPDSPLVTQESSYPVTSHTVAEHGVVVFQSSAF